MLNNLHLLNVWMMYPCTGKAEYLYNINQTIVFSIALIKLRK